MRNPFASPWIGVDEMLTTATRAGIETTGATLTGRPMVPNKAPGYLILYRPRVATCAVDLWSDQWGRWAAKRTDFEDAMDLM